MLNQQKNDLLSRVGKGTGAGSVLRQYWRLHVLCFGEYALRYRGSDAPMYSYRRVERVA